MNPSYVAKTGIYTVLIYRTFSVSQREIVSPRSHAMRLKWRPIHNDAVLFLRRFWPSPAISRKMDRSIVGILAMPALGIDFQFNVDAGQAAFCNIIGAFDGATHEEDSFE